MDFRDFTAGQNDDNRRLDRVLRKFLQEKSLSEIYKLLRKGLIKVNHSKAKPETHINCGDVISIAAFLFDSDSKKQDSSFENQNKKTFTTPLEIVFENEHLLIINKPYNRTVHGEKDGLYKDVLSYYQNNCSKKNDSLSFKPGPLHRLDKRTTGLLVFSKSLEGARWFTEGIQKHTIQKSYYALLQGKLDSEYLWEDYIFDEETDSQKNNNQFFHKVQVNANAKGDKAISFVKPIASGKINNKDVTLARFDIKTGRKHQIRAQSAFHYLPLLGDTAYGANPLGNSKSQNPGKREFYLQAFRLSFPQNNPLELPQEIKIPLSSDFVMQLHCCEITEPGL